MGRKGGRNQTGHPRATAAASAAHPPTDTTSLRCRAHTETKRPQRTAGDVTQWHGATGYMEGGRRGRGDRAEDSSKQVTDTGTTRCGVNNPATGTAPARRGISSQATGMETTIQEACQWRCCRWQRERCMEGEWGSLEDGGDGQRRSLMELPVPPSWRRQGIEQSRKTRGGGVKSNGWDPDGLDPHTQARARSPGSGLSGRHGNTGDRVR